MIKQLPLTCDEPLHLILRVQGMEKLTNKDRAKVHEAASNFATTDIYFTPYNIGTAAARLDLTHRGAKTGYQYLMFTDDDIEFSKNGIDKQVEVLDNNPGVGSVSLRPSHKRFLRAISDEFVILVNHKEITDDFCKIYLVGSASIMFRSFLYKDFLIAPDPEYYIGLWDLDFVMQIRESGYDAVEIPKYTIKNLKGGCERYLSVRRRKEYIKYNKAVSIKKWGFDLAQFYTGVIRSNKGKVKMPIIKGTR